MSVTLNKEEGKKKNPREEKKAKQCCFLHSKSSQTANHSGKNRKSYPQLPDFPNFWHFTERTAELNRRGLLCFSSSYEGQQVAPGVG